MLIRSFIIATVLTIPFPAHTATVTTVKTLASVEGVRDNQLVGYGIVVGLNGTGDKLTTLFSAQSLTNLLNRMGVNVNPALILIHNTASVLVTADLPPFSQPGTRLDVTVAAIGDATNLQGGLLVLTPLKAANGEVYAVSQGSVVTGGFAVGKSGNSQTVNHPTAGRIPNGAIIERASPSVEPGDRVRLQLQRPDFLMASRIADAVNHKFSPKTPIAHSDNAGLVTIDTPPDWRSRTVEFIAMVQEVPIEASNPARVVVNERTGTIVLGGDVKIGRVSILHGGLSIDIETEFQVSQPQGFSNGQTTVTPQTNIAVKEDKAHNVSLKEGANVEQLVRALLSIGSTPRDIIAILQSVKAAGALDAELEVI